MVTFENNYCYFHNHTGLKVKDVIVIEKLFLLSALSTSTFVCRIEEIKEN